MDGESLSYKALKNSAYNFLGYAWPIVFSIFITPVVVYRLGVQDYGVYILINSIIGILGLLDLGLSVSLLKYISEYHAKNNFSGLKDLINSANTLFLMIGFLGLLIFWLVGNFGLSFFHITQTSLEHIKIVFLLAGFLFFVNAVNSVFRIIPNALQRFDVSTKISLSQLTLFNLGILALVLFGYKLKAIMALNLFLTAVFSLVFLYNAKKLLPQVSFGFAWVAGQIRKSYRFGLMSAINNLAANSLLQLDRFLISAFLGPSQLTFYSLPGNVAHKISGVTNSLGTVLFPTISALSGVGDKERIRIAYIKAFRLLSIIAAAMTVAVMVYAKQILFYWLGEEFAQKGTTILIILALTHFLNGFYPVLSSFLFGLNKTKFVVGSSAGLAVVNVFLLLLLLPRYGILGAAFAYLLSLLSVLVIIYWTEKNILNLSGRLKFYVRLYLQLIITGIIFWLLIKWLLLPLVTSLAALILLGPASVVLFLIMYKLFGFVEQEDWVVLKSFLLSARERMLKMFK